MSRCPIIIALDWDAFYCSVEEHFNPELKKIAFAVQQKQIICTCNYVARAQGVKKLQRLVDAVKQFPGLVIVNGEDLSRYRDASKELWYFARDMVWGGKVERLGFDELFLDVTDMIDFNMALLDNLHVAGYSRNLHSVPSFFFRMSQEDPSVGFSCQLESVAGNLATGSIPEDFEGDNLRLVLGSHLCQYIRSQILGIKGYTSSGGVSINKTLAKTAGATHKPNQQTVLFPEFAQDFLDKFDIGKIPWIGHKSKSVILDAIYKNHDPDRARDATVFNVRHLANKQLFINSLGQSSGEKLWDLLHGVDPTGVQPTPDIPTQISIEDSFRSLTSLIEVRTVLRRLSNSLLDRMHIDLMDSNGDWLGHPQTARLSTRSRSTGYYGSRSSRSDSLPSIVFSSSHSRDYILDYLVDRCWMPLFSKVIGDMKAFDIVLLNVAVVNIEKPPSKSSDITSFFGKKHHVNNDIKDGHIEEPIAKRGKLAGEYAGLGEPGFEFPLQEDEDVIYEECSYGESCVVCGQRIMSFALEAHMRFHELAE
ncbi:hypothetical protein V1525DRAFT_360314 [Lipomyces kononenkoae]|uniref:Uncharacterized protein n=1 Tax=Lipomyces kononenkoae TaxID=34357 RepID=A0ACC3T0Z9_LIPKO